MYELNSYERECEFVVRGGGFKKCHPRTYDPTTPSNNFFRLELPVDPKSPIGLPVRIET